MVYKPGIDYANKFRQFHANFSNSQSCFFFDCVTTLRLQLKFIAISVFCFFLPDYMNFDNQPKASMDEVCLFDVGNDGAAVAFAKR